MPLSVGQIRDIQNMTDIHIEVSHNLIVEPRVAEVVLEYFFSNLDLDTNWLKSAIVL